MRRSNSAGERVERSHDVGAVEAEVEREVVARPGRHADVRHIVLHRDLRDEGLRSVSARHADHVGRADGVACERRQIVVGAEENRLDAPLLRLVDQVELLDLAAAGLGIHQQDCPTAAAVRTDRPRRSLNRSGLGPARSLERASRGEGEHSACHAEDDQLVDRPACDQRNRPTRERGDRAHDGDHPDRPSSTDRDPAGGAGNSQSEQDEQQGDDVPEDQHDEGGDERSCGDKGEPRPQATGMARLDVPLDGHVLRILYRSSPVGLACGVQEAERRSAPGDPSC